MTQRDEINLRESLRTIRVQPAKDVHFEEKNKERKNAHTCGHRATHETGGGGGGKK